MFICDWIRFMGKHAMVFVTGTSTGVGKTVLTCLLTESLRASGSSVVALKPLCSGSRADARKLRAAAGRVLSLEEVNPWWFRASLTPWLAARLEGRRVQMKEVVERVRSIQRRFDGVLVEGAGGLLSPLGDGFDARDLIVRLRPRILVVAMNRLGVLNEVLLTLRALPPALSREAQVVLMAPERPDSSTRWNASVLRDRLGSARVQVLPRLGATRSVESSAVRQAVEHLVRWLRSE
jgi:dethiobiotin synthetase